MLDTWIHSANGVDSEWRALGLIMEECMIHSRMSCEGSLREWVKIGNLVGIILCGQKISRFQKSLEISFPISSIEFYRDT